MKRITAIALFAAATTLGLGTAFAQGYAVRATMPFDFTVGSKTLPAGNYKINNFHSDLIEIQNLDKDASVLSVTFSDDAQSKNGGAVLIFDKCGDQYFLREVLAGSAGSMNVNLPLSKAEQRARQQESMAKVTQVSVPLTAGY